MEPKYTIHTSLSEEEFIRFNRYLIHQNKRSMTIIIVSTLLVLAFAIDHFIRGVNLPIAVGLLVGLLIAVWNITLGADRKAKKYYRSYIAPQMAEQTISFFEDHLEQTTQTGNGSIPYAQLHKIYRTKTNLYLMRSPQVGTILPLASCPEGLVDYIMQIKQQHSL